MVKTGAEWGVRITKWQNTWCHQDETSFTPELPLMVFMRPFEINWDKVSILLLIF